MAKRPTPDSVQGIFPTGTVTIRESKDMAGGTYRLVGATLSGRKTIHTLKNAAGEYKDFDHDHLITLIDKPEPIRPPRDVPFQFK